PDHLRAGDLRRLPRRLERHAGAPHAADGGDQRHLGDHHRGRHARRRAHRIRPRQDDGCARRRAGRGQRLRRLPGHAPNARDVQEEVARQGRQVGNGIPAQGRLIASGPASYGANSMSMNLVVMLYLVASVCFIQALKGLSHPTTSRRGNTFGMVGMAIAILTTVALLYKLRADIATVGMAWVLLGLLVGGTIGTIMARRVEMTKMPELVAFMHSMIGLAAVFIAIAVVAEPDAFNIVERGQPIPIGNRIELFIGTFVGAITFSGSVIAFGKLSGKYKFRLFQGAPVVFAGQHMLNLALAIAMIAFGIWFAATEAWTPYLLMLAIAF